MAKIEVDYSLADNSPDGNVEIYRSTSSGTLGSLVTTRAPSDPTTYTDTGLSNGVKYYYTVRRNTDHATVDSAQDAQYAKPVAPDAFSVVSLDGDDITGSWNDNATNEDGYRRMDSTDGGSTFSVIGSDLAADTTQATWSGLSRPDTHTLTVRAFVGSGSAEATADSGTVERVLLPSQSPTAGAEWVVEVEHSSGRVARPDVIGQPQFQPRLNALPRIEIPVRRDESWLNDAWTDATLRVWRNGQRLPIDTLVDREVTPEKTVFRGRGGSELLRQADLIIDEKEVDDTLRDLVSNKTGYATNVDDPNAATTTDTLIQEATTSTELQNILASSLADDTPLYFPPSSGLIGPAQTFFHFLNDGGDDSPSGQYSEEFDGTNTNENWEDADVIRLDAQGDYVEFEFNVNHRIPAARVGAAFRWEYDGDGGEIPTRVEINGIPIIDLNFGGSKTDIGWSADYGDQYGFSLDPGSNPHTLRFEIDNAPTGGGGEFWRLDVLSVYDTQYHASDPPVNFPNQIETDSNEPDYLYLPGPRKYPSTVQVELDDATPPISVSGARESVDIGSTYTAHQLELSADSGTNWPISGTDTTEIQGDFASLSATARARITLGARGTGQAETPADGYAGPELLLHELYADLDETPLFVSQNFQGRILDVALEGAQLADAVFEIQWDSAAGTQSFEWTQPGQRTTAADASVSDYETTRTTEERKDRIRVIGRSVPVADESFTANHGTAVPLNNDHIQPDSETVEDSSTQYTQGQDYVIDWEAGEITTLSSGTMTDGNSYVISYRWNPVGTADRAGASSPFTVRKVELPQLSTVRECEITARRLRDATAQPLWEATVDLPPDEIGLTVIDELNIVSLPGSETLEVRGIDSTTGGQSARLGNRASFSEKVEAIRRRLSATAENT